MLCSSCKITLVDDDDIHIITNKFLCEYLNVLFLKLILNIDLVSQETE